MRHLFSVLRIHIYAAFVPLMLLLMNGVFLQDACAFPLLPHASLSARTALPASPFPVQKVHGCHRYPYKGPLSRKLHRHVGPFCQWKRVLSILQQRTLCPETRVLIRGKCAIVCQFERNGKDCRRKCYLDRVPRRCL